MFAQPPLGDVAFFVCNPAPVAELHRHLELPIEAASAAQHVLAVCGCGLEVEVELKQHQAHAQALVHRLQSVVEVAPHQLLRARLHLIPVHSIKVSGCGHQRPHEAGERVQRSRTAGEESERLEMEQKSWRGPANPLGCSCCRWDGVAGAVNLHTREMCRIHVKSLLNAAHAVRVEPAAAKKRFIAPATCTMQHLRLYIHEAAVRRCLEVQTTRYLRSSVFYVPIAELNADFLEDWRLVIRYVVRMIFLTKQRLLHRVSKHDLA
mmetsp:Transcript_24950/g.47371  ORF Transcript_24950/g.47371 Transcript_24950/m.47371 type:complete len:264 (-) Transcript_24950:72-863(-)